MEKIEKPYLDDVGTGHFLSKLKSLFSLKSHSHKASDIEDLQSAIGELSNTTYTLSKMGNKIVLTGSDKSETSVQDDNTTSYNDLTDKPVIPTNNNQLDNGAGYITEINSSMVTTALGYTPQREVLSDTEPTLSNGEFWLQSY